MMRARGHANVDERAGAATPVRSALLLVALLALPLAAAGGPAPQEEQLVVFAPLVVDPSGSATMENDGMALLRGSGALDGFELRADRLRVTLYRERVECVGLAGVERCAPVPGSPETETLDLRAATLRAKGELLDDFEAVVTLRSEHLAAHADAPGGTLAFAHGSTRAELDVASRAGISPAGATSHVPVEQVAPHGSTFAPRADDYLYRADEAAIAADGRFGLYLSGVAVHLLGTDADGEPVDRVVVTGRTITPAPYGRTEAIELLFAEAAEARLDARYVGDAMLLGRPTIQADAVTVVAAVGTIQLDGERRDVSGNERLVGSTTFRPIDHRIDGDTEAWLILHTMDPVALAAAVPAAPERASIAGALAVGAVAGAGAGALASLTLAGFLRWDAIRYAASPALARLYSRIARDEVLDHRHREAILRAVREAPGVTPKELASASELAWTTVAYHLRRLAANGLVVLHRDGRRMRFYTTEAAPADLHAAYAALRNPTSARLAELVAARPGVTQKEAAEALGLSPSLLSWHATRLESAGVVLKVKEKGRARYHAGPAMRRAEVARPKGG